MNIILTIAIGAVAGIIDVAPMIKMKLDRFAIASAFLFYLILPFIIFNIDLYGMPWWLTGGVIGLLLAVPVIVLAAKEDRKSVPPMAVMSLVLGTLIGVAGHFLVG